MAVLLFCGVTVFAQNKTNRDSLPGDSSHRLTETMLLQGQQQKQIDSLVNIQLQKELQQASGDKQKTKELEDKLKEIADRDSTRKTEQLKRIAELKKNATGFAVAPFYDTLFYIYTRTGSFSARERADAINERINKIYELPFYRPDSLKINETENGYDILYNDDLHVLSVSDLDALWFGKSANDLANEYLAKIKAEIAAEKQANSIKNWVKRIGTVALIMLGLGLIIYIINHLFNKLRQIIRRNRSRFFDSLTIHKIKLLSVDQFEKLLLRLSDALRIVVVVLAVYFSLPLLFSIFPETKAWTDTLLAWVLTPAKSALNGILHFLPNLFTILVIYFIFRYAIRGTKYFVNEIEKGNIQLSGFHADWAQPTFNIVKFLLYAFMFVLIFPYLPGSDSAAFRGVSVFVGIIFSLGSSNAIANMVAGLVITYMRPFKIGDRVKIGDVTGDVIEKTMLVTRIRSIKNEDITLPNSTVLSTSTVNYSTNTNPEDVGLIVHTTVTIGYDVPWKNIHQALIDAAGRTEMILLHPKPFVLQTSLDDFYVSYQVNAYTREANEQATIYSYLHQHIQDCCNESGIEILSPHYRSTRDGNMTTIPENYLDKNYKAPSFNIKNVKDEIDEK
jgi:small-conductance mechanosensitive channel